ncbi:eukaryotic translation initiation factor 3 subunit J-B-like [Haliotis rufescens]|uniref:eukaryotic translation initiation factor 3 subunit J-B-like n=1 Tax=Haliotis rufescens TaxID=6454 RepID=UPI001EB030BC|nr:eukaryotic translation initiation factor 3 subunit J-B-like [Haliotis rufescens]
MSDEWDADDFEPPSFNAKGVVSDKWEGEDEDQDVKDNWEDSEEEKERNKSEGTEGSAYQRPKKKSLADRIAEKEAKRVQQLEEEKARNREPTAEEKLNEKIRLRKVQEAADLKNAQEIFGVKNAKSIESMYPETEEEFKLFKDALKTKITEFEASRMYPGFIENLFQELAIGLQPEDLKKVGTALTGIYHEKEKQRKEAERKKKKKQKAIVKVERKGDLDLIGGVGEYDYDDGEDFM